MPWGWTDSKILNLVLLGGILQEEILFDLTPRFREKLKRCRCHKAWPQYMKTNIPESKRRIQANRSKSQALEC